MADGNNESALTLKSTRILVGSALLAASLYISLQNATSAAFFLVIGVLCFLDFERLKLLNIGGVLMTELYEKIERRVENAETILREVREIEARMAYVTTQQMLNKGGERYVGGFGEEAEFAVFEGLRETKAAKTDTEVRAALVELKIQLGFQLCHGIFGTRWMAPSSAARKWALATKYEILPTAEKVQELAMADGFDALKTEVYQPYVDFFERGILPDEEIRKHLYDFKNSDCP